MCQRGKPGKLANEEGGISTWKKSVRSEFVFGVSRRSKDFTQARQAWAGMWTQQSIAGFSKKKYMLPIEI